MFAKRSCEFAAAACVAALVGCGSTAQPPGSATVAERGSTQAAPSGGGAELGVYGQDSSSVREQAASGNGLEIGGAAPAGSSAAAQAGARSRGRAATGRSTESSPQGPLRLGVIYLKDSATALAAEALEADPGDLEGALRAVVADINRRGGVSGRRVEVVVHRLTVEEATDNPPLAAERACRKLTEDAHVDVALSGVTAVNIPVLFSCMAKHDVPLMAVDANPHSLRTELVPYARHLYHPSTVALERLAPTWVQRLVAKRYFSSWDTTTGAPGAAPLRVGIVQQSGNEFYADAVRAALRAHALPAPEVVEYSSYEDARQNMLSYAFNLKQKGVTHVFIDKPLSTVFFTTVAESQAYRPRYALTSFNGPTLGLANQKPVPKQQLRGALGVGFLPLVDVAESRIDSRPGSMAHRCETVARAAGVDPGTGNFGRQAQLAQCEGLLLLDQAYDAAGATTSQALQRGMEQGRLQAVATHSGAIFHAGRHDGAAFVRDFVYVEATNSFVYQGGLHRLP